jgi:predicted esterase
VIERTIAAAIHGRYLVESPAAPGPAPLLVGFHGYGEAAEAQLERMRAIPGAGRWRLVAIQALHRFYQRRSQEVVASWMTRQDRDLAIADNAAYVTGVLDAVSREWPAPPRIFFTGFSQGVAMTFRAAVTAPQVNGIIAVGGDIPPEIDTRSLGRLAPVLLCRGSADQWYTAEKFDHDASRLTAAGVGIEKLQFVGGHEWGTAVLDAAARFLQA